MPEPTVSATTATLALAAGAVSAVPVVAAVSQQLVLFGVPLGLRADVLLAGFFGSLAAMAFLNTVPSTGDTLRELLRTSARRITVALASALTAGYATPLLLLFNGILTSKVPDSILLGAAFTVGAGAQGFLADLVEKGRKAKLAAAAAAQKQEEVPRADV